MAGRYINGNEPPKPFSDRKAELGRLTHRAADLNTTTAIQQLRARGYSVDQVCEQLGVTGEQVRQAERRPRDEEAPTRREQERRLPPDAALWGGPQNRSTRANTIGPWNRFGAATKQWLRGQRSPGSRPR
jgi:hypothetical protein